MEYNFEKIEKENDINVPPSRGACVKIKSVY